MSLKRCAIYTRKSSEEGLEQDFNSLDAQREACSAYIRSQAGEGWKALPTAYDDGGFSGGNLDRPALVRLLADVRAGRVDTVVVYKVDRLTRSLADFAKIVEVLDAAGASFVSVTQAFNTTTSMGRLTLNVLLSFAQFEREVTGERIRDKIAMSKAKGIWMGGMVPLGYDLAERRLVINPDEAELIRHIFRRYLELGSAHRLRDELESAGVRSKRWLTRTGRELGGKVFNRGGVFHILRSRLYIGEIVHKGAQHAGLHPAIIDRELFDAVQARLDAQTTERRAGSTRVASSVLAGRIFDADGEPMTPSFSYGRKGKAYRYYIARAYGDGRRPDHDEVLRRVSADTVELHVAKLLGRLSNREVSVLEAPRILLRLELRRTETHLVLRGAELAPDRHPATMISAVEQYLREDEVVVWESEAEATLRVILPARLKLRGGRVWLDGEARSGSGRASRGLSHILRASHAELLALQASPLTPLDRSGEAKSPSNLYRRQLARLVFLAPDLQEQILRGAPLADRKLSDLTGADLPLAWADQRAWLAKKDT